MSETSGSDGAMRVDTDMVQTLARMLTENGLTEIEVVDGGRSIAVRRTVTAAATHSATVATPSAPAAATPLAVPPPPLAAEPSGPHPGTVPSPMVGTVYLSAEPGSRPLVSVGDRVQAGDTLLIIEAMKVMNQIVAPHSGTVAIVFVHNAEPVEFDQPLLVIE